MHDGHGEPIRFEWSEWLHESDVGMDVSFGLALGLGAALELEPIPARFICAVLFR